MKSGGYGLESPELKIEKKETSFLYIFRSVFVIKITETDILFPNSKT